MRILLVHPNQHSGGAEIAGNWPPAWVAYIAAIRPDVVGATALTPAIYMAERLLEIAKEVDPEIVTVLGGIHGTFMNPHVFREAPWIDAIVCGEGEQVFLKLISAIDAGRWPADRAGIKGIAYTVGGRVVTTPAEPPIEDTDRIEPDWSRLEWHRYRTPS